MNSESSTPKQPQPPSKYTRVFDIRGATHTDPPGDKQVIWLCRFWGEPFWVHPEESEELRKKWWKYELDKYIGGKVEAHYNEQDKKGIPLGHVTGVVVGINKKYEKHHDRKNKRFLS